MPKLLMRCNQVFGALRDGALKRLIRDFGRTQRGLQSVARTPGLAN
jgi:hypothetical protein